MKSKKSLLFIGLTLLVVGIYQYTNNYCVWCEIPVKCANPSSWSC